MHFLYGASPTSQLVLNFLYGADSEFYIFVWEAQLDLVQEVGKFLYGSWQVKHFKVPDSQSLQRAQLVLNFLYGAETKFCIFVWEAQLDLAQEVGEILYGSLQVKNFKV